VVPNLFPTIVLLSLLSIHATSTTLFPVLSKQSVLVLSFEYLTDISNVSIYNYYFLILAWFKGKDKLNPRITPSCLAKDRIDHKFCICLVYVLQFRLNCWICFIMLKYESYVRV
jgi:hypothetical protein